MTDFFISLLNRSIQASWLILAIILLRLCFRKMPRRWICLLWGLAAIRLLCPFSFQSIFSLMPATEPIYKVEIEITSLPSTDDAASHAQLQENGKLPDNAALRRPVYRIQTGMAAFDERANSYLGADKLLIAENEYGAADVSKEQRMKYTLPDVAAIIWGIGVCAMILYAIFSCAVLRRKVRFAGKTPEGIYRCDEIDSPFILGVFLPKIYVPSALTKDALEYVSAHEKAHLKRLDHMWKPVGYLILAVYWFHPLVWAAYILFSRDVELACDEKVIADKDKAYKRAYAQTLLDCSRPKHMVMYPLAFGEISVKERIRSVMNYRKPTFWIILAAAAAGTVLILCFMTEPREKNPGKTPDADTPAVSLSEGADGPTTVLNRMEMDLGDLDGDGVGESAFIESNTVQEGISEVNLTVSWSDASRIQWTTDYNAGFQMTYEDYDGDGAKEFLIVASKLVGDRVLEDYAVFKQQGSEWVMLEKYQGNRLETDNSLPILVMTDANYDLVITCGNSLTDHNWEKRGRLHTRYNVKHHLERIQQDAYYASYAEAMLAFTQGVQGEIFGRSSESGMQAVRSTTWQDMPCIAAEHRIVAAPPAASAAMMSEAGEEFDVLGNLTVYFDYDKNGEIHLIHQEFVPIDPETSDDEVIFEEVFEIQKGRKAFLQLRGKSGDDNEWLIGSAEIYTKDRSELITQFFAEPALAAMGIGDLPYAAARNQDGGLVLEDIDFDGYTDIGLQVLTTAYNQPMLFWRYNSYSKRYEPFQYFLMPPTLDAKARTCTVEYHDGQVYYTDVYKPDSELKLYLDSRTVHDMTGGTDKETRETTAVGVSEPLYRDLLIAMMQKRVLPGDIHNTMFQLDERDVISDNHYAVADIDNDGQEELIIRYANASAHAGSMFLIYGMDKDRKAVHLELIEYPDVQFIWENNEEDYSRSGFHFLRAAASHNHGRAYFEEDNFWPYNLYHYSYDSNTYEFVGSVDGWDSRIDTDKFPAEYDKDGNGMIYYLADENGNVIRYFDDAEYSEWKVGADNPIDMGVRLNWNKIH